MGLKSVILQERTLGAESGLGLSMQPMCQVTPPLTPGVEPGDLVPQENRLRCRIPDAVQSSAQYFYALTWGVLSAGTILFHC
ncbi:hypothetical protein EVAR_59463_1 [Eumeta japonica]|uniref:Uncharacterized protein n=1 Tax=Eumeta variegata TaxID=151549 RepID=A0A4C1Z1Z8_EUMVA|nr:hypothetical protein EVAR_59463_1 [Eumeta japonica]